eukprot:NODE_883_length_3472_cov_0.125704.p2 type:complete len:253 gc:universal NODE_883_length_3472_cov_0.125704:1992-2750(+)
MQVGDKVFARQGPLLYDAVILEIDSSRSCVIHYIGWNAKFDEEVKEEDLLEVNDENTAFKEKLEQYYSENRDDLPDVQCQLQFLNRRSINLELPLPLRARLADDFEAITRQKMLVPLPHSVNLHELMKRFAGDQIVSQLNNSEDLQEFCRGLIWYFNSCLPKILLYPRERLQYMDYISKDPSAVYGADHLLRLLVKMPFILKESNMPSSRLTQLQQFLIDLMNWLQHHKEVFCFYKSMSLQYMSDLEAHITF